MSTEDHSRTFSPTPSQPSKADHGYRRSNSYTAGHENELKNQGSHEAESGPATRDTSLLPRYQHRLFTGQKPDFTDSPGRKTPSYLTGRTTPLFDNSYSYGNDQY